jgi:predicted DsbA family dithiol-disulfide isomerase
VTSTAAAEGLEYDFNGLVVANSFAAHELLHLAKEHGVSDTVDAVKEALLSAHFEEAQDISDRQVLVAIAASAGLDAAEVNAALDSRRYRESVNEDIRQARSLGIRGVPFFVIDSTWGISGAQPTELFSQALDHAWRERNPLVMVQPQDDDSVACGPDGCAI